MDKNTRILVAGGDLRQVCLAQYLSRHFIVKTYGLGESSPEPELLRGFDILILPVIVSPDGENLNAPFCEAPVALNRLTYCLKENGIVFGGIFKEGTAQIFSGKGFKVFEYYEREELVIKNCIPTAEGALQIAMEELPVTVNGLKTLVLGFGRVGKITSQLFFDTGADVVCTARKQSDLALCQAMGIKAQKTSEALNSPEAFELIINTIPAMVVDKTVLEKVSKDCLIIDLASKPGGVDFLTAKELGVKAIRALSLPREVTGAKLLIVNSFHKQLFIQIKVCYNYRTV